MNFTLLFYFFGCHSLINCLFLLLFDAVLENLKCPGCGMAFSSVARLGKHFRASQLCHTKWESVVVGERKVIHRLRCTIDTKCTLLDELVELEQKQVPMAQSVLRVRHSNISAKNISSWSKQPDLLFTARDDGYDKFQSLVIASRVKFKEQEEVLYLLFLRRRQDGDETDDDWLRDTMDFLMSEMRPMFWDKFKCSNGWLWRFKKRYRITVQCQTNKKDCQFLQSYQRLKSFMLGSI